MDFLAHPVAVRDMVVSHTEMGEGPALGRARLSERRQMATPIAKITVRASWQRH
jgi:hypothetical protein